MQRLRAVGPGQWHITLRFLGQVDDDLLPVLFDALGHAAAYAVGPVRCIDRAAEAVREATIPVVPDPTPRRAPFAGHLTIARVKGRRLDPSARATVAGIPFTAEFAVQSLAVVASHLSAEGPHYSTLARLPLPT